MVSPRDLQFFQSFKDKDLDDVAYKLLVSDIDRRTFFDVCRWLQIGIQMCDFPPDRTLDLLMDLSGRVGTVHRSLLREALHKWQGVIQTFILDEENRMRTVSASWRGGEQLPLPLGYGNTPVNTVKPPKIVRRFQFTLEDSGMLKGVGGKSCFYTQAIMYDGKFYHCTNSYKDLDRADGLRERSHYLYVRKGKGYVHFRNNVYMGVE